MSLLLSDRDNLETPLRSSKARLYEGRIRIPASAGMGVMNLQVWERLATFVAIGGFGFGVEAVIITLATSKFGFSATGTRLFSFPCAVLLTWWLNRQYNFRSHEGVWLEVGRYFATQGLGALTNLAVFASCLAIFPSLAAWPVLVLGLGAFVGLAVNFILSCRYVFKRRKRD